MELEENVCLLFAWKVGNIVIDTDMFRVIGISACILFSAAFQRQ